MNNTPKKRISLFIPKFEIEECLEQIRECLELGWTGAGFKTDELEKEWNRVFNFSNSLFLNSASAGLEIACIALKELGNWEDGSEIITTPLTFVSTNHAILRADLQPVFSDVDDSLCIDPVSVRKNITKKTKGLIFVGIGGNLGNYDEIVKICQEFDLKLIVDAAHMAGTRAEFFNVGESAAVVYSFQAVKNLPSADSGMLCTNDEKLYGICKKLSWMGINLNTYERNNTVGSYKWEYDVDFLGFKYNGNSIMASIVLTQLKNLEKDNIRRREIVSLYSKLLPESNLIKHISRRDDQVISAHLMQVRVLNGLRNKLIEFLGNNGIDTGVHYRLNTHYKMYSFALGQTPKAEIYDKEILSLPIHLNLSNDDVQFVASKIKEMEKICV
jgi:dTDP-4-amino-4,6-dideoxygalactose transaminase